MGFYGEQVLPRVVDIALGNRECTRLRERVTANLEGDVLEIGFGSGLNVPLYPSSVTRVQAVDPATIGRKLAERRVAASTIPVEYVGLDGEDLPLDDESVDYALINVDALHHSARPPCALGDPRASFARAARCTSSSTVDRPTRRSRTGRTALLRSSAASLAAATSTGRSMKCCSTLTSR